MDLDKCWSLTICLIQDKVYLHAVYQCLVEDVVICGVCSCSHLNKFSCSSLYALGCKAH